MKKIAALAVLATLLLSACGTLEPSATDLVRGASAKMQSAKTVHFDGTGSFGLKGGFSMSFDFKMSGDYDLPDRSRTQMSMSLLGQSLDFEMLTIGGKAYMKDPNGKWTEQSSMTSTSASTNPFLGSDPLSGFDLSTVADVVEVDRPVIDGKTTRHLRFTVDAQKMADAMRQSMGSTGASAQPKVSPTASGELWIRVDDGQIVRQAITVAIAMDDLPGGLFGSIAGASAPTSKVSATIEMGFDFKFSKHGEPVPFITVPPLSTPAPTAPLRTSPPLRSPTPLPTH